MAVRPYSIECHWFATSILVLKLPASAFLRSIFEFDDAMSHDTDGTVRICRTQSVRHHAEIPAGGWSNGLFSRFSEVEGTSRPQKEGKAAKKDGINNGNPGARHNGAGPRKRRRHNNEANANVADRRRHHHRGAISISRSAEYQTRQNAGKHEQRHPKVPAE